MQKKISFLLIGMVFWAFQARSQKQPTIYPGCVLQFPDQNYSYLTKDNFEKVKAYYTKETGSKPRTVHATRSQGKSVFFLYVRQKPDDVGVTISSGSGNSRVPARIFDRLQGLVVQGVIPESRVKEIENKYQYLKHCYFAREKNEKGEYESADQIIFKKYDQTLGVGFTEPANQEETMKKVQELMAAGRMSEGMELMKQMQEEVTKKIEVATSEAAVDGWIECLEEISAKAYNTQLGISR